MTEEKKEYLPSVIVGEGTVFTNPSKFDFAQRASKGLIDATMVPDHFRGNMGNCLIALNFADRMGVDPFMLMQSMYVVHGKPGLEGKLVAALVNSSGKYKTPLRYRWVDGDDKEMPKAKVVNDSKRDHRGCFAYTTAQDGHELSGPKIDWEIVYSEGWYGKRDSKWKTLPELMFCYRAASWFANLHCPELKLGMHTVEELKDITELAHQADGSYAATPKIEELKKAVNKSAVGVESSEAIHDKVGVAAADHDCGSPQTLQASGIPGQLVCRVCGKGWDAPYTAPKDPMKDAPSGPSFGESPTNDLRKTSLYRDFDPIAEPVGKRYAEEKKLRLMDLAQTWGVDMDPNLSGAVMHQLLITEEAKRQERFKGDQECSGNEQPDLNGDLSPIAPPADTDASTKDVKPQENDPVPPETPKKESTVLRDELKKYWMDKATSPYVEQAAAKLKVAVHPQSEETASKMLDLVIEWRRQDSDKY